MKTTSQTPLTDQKWFLVLTEKNGDSYMELMLSENGGYAEEEGNDDYMRVSGFCNQDSAKLMAAAPQLLNALKEVTERLERVLDSAYCQVGDDGTVEWAKGIIKSATE